jgi:hypothetical protein
MSDEAMNPGDEPSSSTDRQRARPYVGKVVITVPATGEQQLWTAK